MSSLHCPNCAHPITRIVASVRLTTCASCGSTLFLEQEQTLLAGEQGVMHDVPMLFGLGDTIRLGRQSVQILGHARFSYGRGFWEEFWALDDDGAPIWVSLDEGDIVLQRGLSRANWPKYDGYLKLGWSITYGDETFTVVEDDTAECIAVRGSFDQALLVGEHYRFVNLQGEDGTFLSGEFLGAEREWYSGHWYDPFDVEVRR